MFYCGPSWLTKTLHMPLATVSTTARTEQRYFFVFGFASSLISVPTDTVPFPPGAGVFVLKTPAAWIA